MVSKSELRKKVKEDRLKIQNKEEKEEIIINKVLSCKKVLESKNILVYISTKNEVSTKILIEKLFKLKKNIYAPKVINNIIKFYKINSFTELEVSKFGILEPISGKEYNLSEDVIIVPGLLFDKNMNRLGYGGGYYDKYLTNTNLCKIGICFHEFLIDRLETFPHDVKMNMIITEKEIYGI